MEEVELSRTKDSEEASWTIVETECLDPPAEVAVPVRNKLSPSKLNLFRL